MFHSYIAERQPNLQRKDKRGKACGLKALLTPPPVNDVKQLVRPLQQWHGFAHCSRYAAKNTHPVYIAVRVLQLLNIIVLYY